jgi:uncharacterized membrane protein
MFLFTGVTHFTGMKHDYLAMMPSGLPAGLWIIYLAGIFEIAGAIGLLIPATGKIAGVYLVLLLIVMFPANVNAALGDIPLNGRAPTPLWLRAPIQLVYILMIWWSSIREPRGAAEKSVQVS